MANLYIENSEKWKSLASIDYFTQFIKAWIPFNAWYKNCFSELKTDRQKIDYIKAENNKFRAKLISLLKSQDNDGSAFKSRIIELYLELERKHLFNKGERITFEKIVIESNPKSQNTFDYNNFIYEVQRKISGKPQEQVESYFIKNGNSKFSCTQSKFNIDELSENQDFCKLSIPQQKNLMACYKEINPSKPISLISSDPNYSISMGNNIHFVKDIDKLCKGIIEILYKLRNVLFHGEIIPDKDTNKVYEPAYHILHMLIQAL